uniref:RETREG1-3/ARL6IP-like N-terminal reticulon-homology domain-containing protein n=1 Tax=Oncorhynchus tshawytscha TaxID=74940 RepID=A0AAZ3P8Z7_ONCTS
MAHTEGLENAMGECSGKQGSTLGLRSRPSSSERDGQVRVVKASLQERLGPYEPVLTYLQSVLVWERPFQSVLLYTVVNVVFWFFALTSLRLLFLLSSGLLVFICIDSWRNKIWPEIRGEKDIVHYFWVVCFILHPTPHAPLCLGLSLLSTSAQLC